MGDGCPTERESGRQRARRADLVSSAKQHARSPTASFPRPPVCVSSSAARCCSLLHVAARPIFLLVSSVPAARSSAVVCVSLPRALVSAAVFPSSPSLSGHVERAIITVADRRVRGKWKDARRPAYTVHTRHDVRGRVQCRVLDDVRRESSRRARPIDVHVTSRRRHQTPRGCDSPVTVSVRLPCSLCCFLFCVFCSC
jgi:hypothetical protein